MQLIFGAADEPMLIIFPTLNLKNTSYLTMSSFMSLDITSGILKF